MAAFKASARRMDDCYGKVLNALHAAGLAQDTLVCCYTDHGLQFPRNMCNLTDHGLGVYLILRGPGFRGGHAVDAMVSLLDLFPTVCQSAGAPVAPWCEGRSLLPLVRGETHALHDALFGEVNYHAAYEPMRSVRTDRYHYIRRFDGRDRWVLPNIDDTPTKEYLLAQGFAHEPREAEMLYDVVMDPDESNNLVHRPALAHVLGELRTIE
jgi:arylsulfatase A-like enzyme